MEIIHKNAIKVLFIAVFAVLLFLFGYGQYLNMYIGEDDSKMETYTSDCVRDTVYDTLMLHDTIIRDMPKYITSVSYTNAYPAKLDTFVYYKGNTAITVSFAYGDMEFVNVKEYKVLCNGCLFEKNYDTIATFTECNGEWLIVIKGER